MMEALLGAVTFMRVENNMKTLHAVIDRRAFGVYIHITTPSSLRARELWNTLRMEVVWGDTRTTLDNPTTIVGLPHVRNLDGF